MAYSGSQKTQQQLFGISFGVRAAFSAKAASTFAVPDGRTITPYASSRTITTQESTRTVTIQSP